MLKILPVFQIVYFWKDSNFSKNPKQMFTQKVKADPLKNEKSPFLSIETCLISFFQIEKSQGEIYRLRAKLESTQTENENMADELEKMQRALNQTYADRDRMASDLDKVRDDLERSQVSPSKSLFKPSRPCVCILHRIQISLGFLRVHRAPTVS